MVNPASSTVRDATYNRAFSKGFKTGTEPNLEAPTERIKLITNDIDDSFIVLPFDWFE